MVETKQVATSHDEQPLLKQAITLLADRYGVSAEQAYDLLGQEAMAYRVFLRDIAAAVVSARQNDRPLGAILEGADLDRRAWCERQ
jgi:AmiR/NasT family two-component response regulator